MREVLRVVGAGLLAMACGGAGSSGARSGPSTTTPAEERAAATNAEVRAESVAGGRTQGVAGGRSASDSLFNDCHVHLTNYVQEGTEASALLELMGSRVEHAVLFGIPLQQTWSHRISGDRPPTYYLSSDAPLYYYSFTDAFIAEQYLGLPQEQRRRFYPMITGFNPADMYGVDHIRRVLATYPGVFVGVGEFTIHKEFVSGKVAPEVPSLLDPALDRILDFAEEVGLLVLIHNDVTTPFPKQGDPPAYFEQLKALFRRHAGATLVWAHGGVGRVVHPVENHLALLAHFLEDPALSHLYVDLSWSEVAKYVVSSPEVVERTAAFVEKHQDRFLFGTDEVAPTELAQYLSVYRTYEPLWQRLSPEASEKVRRTNCVRLLEAAETKVRAWEAEHLASKTPTSAAPPDSVTPDSVTQRSRRGVR